MLQNFVVGIPEQPFLLLLWVMACFTLVFVFTIELLATLWVVSELRMRLHKLKVQKRKQENELARLNQQQTPPRTRTAPPSVQRTVRQPTRRFTNFNPPQDDWH